MSKIKVKEKTIYNFANFLSISRIFAAIFLIICFEKMNYDSSYKLYSILTIFYIFLSDIFDGYFARLSNCVTDFGKIIDPVADKVCFMVVLIYLIDKFQFDTNFTINPFLIFYILLVIRDLILISFSLYMLFYKDYVNQANIYGKIFVFISMIMIILYIYDVNQFFAYILYCLSIFMMIFSTYFYIYDLNKKLK